MNKWKGTFTVGELCQPCHTGKPVENGKAFEGATQRKQACLTSTYPYEPKSKLPKLTKLIELEQSTNQGHPRNIIQLYSVRQGKLWRIGVQGTRKKGWGEAGGVETKDD